MPPLARLFAYDAWANAEALRSVSDAGAPPAALRLIAHVGGAGRLWRARIAGEAPGVAVWPAWTVDECRGELRRLAADWAEYLGRLDARESTRAVAYTNSKGEPWTTAVDDILAHVILHSSYHRGQVAHVLRAGGAEPAYTDYAHCVRSGLIV
jgi:uncharacterized damage-inducible protein DinB